MVDRVQVSDRLTRRDYFAAAMAILAEDGVAELTTTRLCDRLEVTDTGQGVHSSERDVAR